MFSKLSDRNSLDVNASDRFAWYRQNGGENQEEMEWRVTLRWLEENLPQMYIRNFDDLLRRGRELRPGELLSEISSVHASPMVELLDPRSPSLFLNSQLYSLTPTLFKGFVQPPFTQEVLQECTYSKDARLSAACLFALTGSLTCLEALLDLGADPNGLDTPESWSYIKLLNGKILPVSPMDCALLSGQEDCQQALELFGGVSLHENLPS